MVLKVKSERRGKHVVDRIFAGPEEGRLQLAGTVHWSNVGEWQEFGAALLLGSQRMHGNLTVVLEGGDAVVAEELKAMEDCE